MSSKNVLFYSNYCNFSKEVLGDIIKRNIRDLFVLVCVDQNRYTLPPFVDRVPLIVTPQKEIITDESLSKYIEELHKQHGNAEIEAFTVSTSRMSMFSDPYSFIDDNITSNSSHGTAYVFLGNAEEQYHIQIPPEDDGCKNKFDASMLENIKAQRAIDEETLKKRMLKQ